jgi:exosortase F-associated protein
MNKRSRWVVGIFCVIGLILTYLFQRISWTSIGGHYSPTVELIVNKSIRFVLNDFLMLGLLFALFPYKKYMQIAIFIQIAGVFLFLIPYFILKLAFDFTNPTTAFLHRLVVNPVALILLIPAFHYHHQNKQ